VPPKLRQRETYSAIPQPRAVRQAHILSVGNDSALVDSRQLVLQSAGHQVVSISSRAALSKEFLDRFNIVVLCHTIAPRDQIVRSIRRMCPDLPLLLVDEILCGAYCPGEMYVSPKPEILLIAIDEILKSQASAGCAQGNF
jgi:hypothetical protein